MAEEERNDFEGEQAQTRAGEISSSESAGDETKSKSAKKKSKRKTKSRKKKTRRSSTKSKKTKVHAKAKKSDGKTVSVDSILASVLIVSLLANFYLFFENSNLKGEVGDLKSAILTSGPGSSNNMDKPRSTVERDTGGGLGASKQARLDFYVMSECPFGTQVLDAIAPVLEKIGDQIDFNVEYIVTDNGDGTFQSLHGQSEVDENIRQLCAIEYYPEDYKYMDYIVCRNKDLKDSNWEKCADDYGMDADVIKECAEGDEGKELLSMSASQSEQAGARGSPTIYLNEQRYSGGRRENDFMRALCDSMSDQPKACGDIPEPVKVEVTILNDERCAECDTNNLETQLKNVFPGVVFEKIDYGTESGKQLYDEIGVQYLPAVLFTSDVEDADGYSNIQRYLIEAGGYMSLRIGADFDPTAEICDNGIDDTGNGKVDCEDETCEGSLACRREINERLDVFVMSMCPYGTRALDAMEEVLDAFPDMDFNVNYIATYDEDSDSFNALHGQPEVEENIRQLCAIKHYPQDYKYMQYIWCRNDNIRDTDWEKCATENGMDTQKLKKCSEGEEGKNLHKENIKLAEQLGIGASPTWLANNKYTFSGITAEGVKQNYCEYNEGLPGCDKTLSGATGAVPAGGSC